MKGMYTCKICDRDFPLLEEEHYTTKIRKTGLSAIAGGEERLHDAFDCPHCGCQNIVGERETAYCECFNPLCDDCEGCPEDDDGDEEDEDRTD